MQYNTIIFRSILLVCVLLIVSCKDDKPAEQPPVVEEVVPKKNVKIPIFNSDSAYQYVASQVDFGYRDPGSEGHAKCKDWLSSKLKEMGAKVVEQDFNAKIYTGKSFKGTNIIGSFNPSHKRRVLLGAHWDSRFMADHDPDLDKRGEKVMGADDGGSGVGVLIEIARLIKENPIDLGIDIIFFDLEDQGADTGTDPNTWCLGAQHWAKNNHVSSYNAKFGILLDMVGTKNAKFFKEGYSMKYAPIIVNKVWNIAAKMGRANYFLSQLGRGITDDHKFVNELAGIKMIDIINASPTDGFGDHWHTTSDDMSNIDRRTLGAVGQVVTAVIYNESAGRF